MASHRKPTLSPVTTLTLGLRQAAAVLTAIGLTVKRKLFNVPKHEPLLRTLAIAFLTALRWTRPAGLLYRDAKPTTGTVIEKWCARNRVPHQIITLEDDPVSVLHLIGEPKVNTIYYMHGGGYIEPVTDPGHLSFTHECAQAADCQIALLEYTLAPGLRYPGQLIQAVHGLISLLSKHDASNLILAGDSAGGNICLALLAHVRHGSSYAPPVNLRGQQFRGACLLSPWVGMDLATDSYRRNHFHDYITRDGCLNAMGHWQPKVNDVQANLLCGSKVFWNDVTTLTSKLVITGGTREIFYDDILEMAEKLGASENKNASKRLVAGTGEVHDVCLLDSAMKVKLTGTRAEIMEWMSSLRS